MLMEILQVHGVTMNQRKDVLFSALFYLPYGAKGGGGWKENEITGRKPSIY